MTFWSWNLEFPYALKEFKQFQYYDQLRMGPASLNSALLESFLNVSWQNASGITGPCGLRNAGLLIPC